MAADAGAAVKLIAAENIRKNNEIQTYRHERFTSFSLALSCAKFAPGVNGRMESPNLMNDVFICDSIRTPFGRYGGTLATIRTDDLAALPLKALMERNAGVDWGAVDDVIFGCANQAGEDNRNVARMALLLAGLPKEVPGSTVNRLCGSSMDAVGVAARAIRSGETDLMIAGGVESMSRAPFVMGKAGDRLQPCGGDIRHDDRLAFCESADEEQIRRGLDARNGRKRCRGFSKVSRADQDAFSFRTQQSAGRSGECGRLLSKAN